MCAVLCTTFPRYIAGIVFVKPLELALRLSLSFPFMPRRLSEQTVLTNEFT